MAKELKVYTINMKSLDQDIKDPILAGAGDANGRTFRIIFTQEAAAQFSPETKVYLKWKHQELDISGYNVFDQVKTEPPVWEIKWPLKMLHEGHVLCCIEIVDSISISPSVNFNVHVLSDPTDGNTWTATDDYSIFQQAVIHLTSLTEEVDKQVQLWTEQFEGFQEQIDDIREIAFYAEDAAMEALDKSHVHENKSILDSYNLTQDELIDLFNVSLLESKDEIYDFIGPMPENKTVREYIDEVVGSGGADVAAIIEAAKQEAIKTSNNYTVSQLTINEF